MVGLRKYPPVLDEVWFSDLVDFQGGVTAESQLCSLKILLHDAEPALLSSWQHLSDKSKIDGSKIIGIPVGSFSPLTGDLDFAQHKALNILIDLLAADPTSPLPGQVWYRTDVEKLSLRRAAITDRFVTENLAQTLASKTLTTPTIADFSNAGHNHQAAAGGGQLDHGLALIGLGDDDHSQYTLKSILTTRGDLFYRDALIVVRLGLGLAGKVLRSGGTDLAYSTFTIPDTFAAGEMIYASSANVLAALAINATAIRKFLRAVSNGLAWDTLIAGDIPDLDAAKIISGMFGVARGGTGLSSILAGGILYASALDTLSRIGPSAANQVLRSTGANALEIAALVAADIPNLDAAKITTGILVAARGGLGKAADLTGLLNDYVLVYKSATDNWLVEAKPTGGGGGAGWENVICYPWGGTAVLTGDPLYTYTSEVSDITGIYVEAFWFDFDFAAGNVKSIFANLVWAMKITGAGNGYAKWQAATGSHATPGTYYDFTDEHTETGTLYSDHSRSGVAHKITGFPTTTPFVIRLMIKKGTATSVQAEIKSNTYFRVTYKVT